MIPQPKTTKHSIKDVLSDNLVILLFGHTGCLSGETVVGVRKNKQGTKPFTLAKLYEYAKEDGPYFIASMKDGTIRSREIDKVIHSDDKVTYTVTVEGHDPFRATADHRFHTPFGYKHLKDLKVGDEITVQGNLSSKGKKTSRVTRSIVKAKFHPNANQKTIAGRVYSSIKLSWAALEASINGLELAEYVRILNEEPGTVSTLKFIDPSMVVHHKDYNPLNNVPDNLEALTNEQHSALHGEENTVNFGKYSPSISKLESVIEYGIEPTYDICMKDVSAPNFLVNGVVVHNSGKTAQIGELAEYYFKHYKLRTRLYTADRGGWETIKPYVILGIIEVVPVFGETFLWLDHAVKGDKWNGTEWVPGLDPGIGLYAYESMTSIASSQMSWMAGQAGKSINIGGSGSFNFKVGTGKDQITVGSNNVAHYSVAQQQVYEKTMQSQLLPGTVLWTAGDSHGEDDAIGGVIGPQIAGKAKTPEVPAWFKYSFRIAVEMQPGMEPKHVLYTDVHTELAAKGMARGMSNARIPLAGTTKIPPKIEPASLVQVLELLNERQGSAVDDLKRRLGL